MRDLRQIQRYQKRMIPDILTLKRLKNSVKHQETVKNAKKQCETVTDRDTFGFQLLSQTLDIYLHYPSQHSPPGFLPQLGNLYTSIARTAHTFLHLWQFQGL